MQTCLKSFHNTFDVFQILYGMLFIVICYILTNQPWDLDRFILFSIMGILIGLTSQGLGFSIGAICSITVSDHTSKKRYI